MHSIEHADDREFPNRYHLPLAITNDIIERRRAMMNIFRDRFWKRKFRSSCEGLTQRESELA